MFHLEATPFSLNKICHSRQNNIFSIMLSTNFSINFGWFIFRCKMELIPLFVLRLRIPKGRRCDVVGILRWPGRKAKVTGHKKERKKETRDRKAWLGGKERVGDGQSGPTGSAPPGPFEAFVQPTGGHLS